MLPYRFSYPQEPASCLHTSDSRSDSLEALHSLIQIRSVFQGTTLSERVRVPCSAIAATLSQLVQHTR